MDTIQRDLVRQALAELGDGSAAELADFIEQWHGMRIEPSVVAFLRAALRGGPHDETPAAKTRVSTDGKSRANAA
jgi:hypothetical protein